MLTAPDVTRPPTRSASFANESDVLTRTRPPSATDAAPADAKSCVVETVMPSAVAARGVPVVSTPAANVNVCATFATVAAPVTATVICVGLTATALLTFTPVHAVAHVSVTPATTAEDMGAK